MKNTNVEKLLKSNFYNTIKRDTKIHNAHMLIHSDKYKINLNMAEGLTNGTKCTNDQPFHIASIGKLFTSVLTGIMYEQGKLSYEDNVIKYFPDGLINKLHIYKGVDYTNQIKIKHILNHTSGLNDYFEDKPKKGKPMLKLIVENPYHSWSPEEIITWSKENLTSHFPPGTGFHYSDTGYHILGLVLEKVTGMPLHKAFDKYIFSVLDMNSSYLSTNLETKKEGIPQVSNVYMNNINVSDYSILKDDFAGGGIIASAEDLLKFMKAIVHHKIIRKETFEKMKDWAGFFNLFFIGIDYGYGLMNFKTIPLLMPKRYNVWGNAGSIGSFMFYNEATDTYFIGSLNHFRYHRKGIQLMLRSINIILNSNRITKS